MSLMTVYCPVMPMNSSIVWLDEMSNGGDGKSRI